MGIPRTEKDNKEMNELLNTLHNFSSMSVDEMLCSEMYDEVYNKKFMNKLKNGKLYKR